MTRRRGPNIAASIRQRLLNKARETGRPFNEVLQYFAMERFLYRLSKSDHAEKFVLNGALMFTAWQAPVTRPTMDIDLLGITDNGVDAIVTVVKDICRQEGEPDGLVFDTSGVEGERIVEEADYAGVRVRFRGMLGTARITMQLDIGFGDVVVPKPEAVDYPTILDFPAPSLRGYSRESAVAEKFEAMVKLGVRIRECRSSQVYKRTSLISPATPTSSTAWCRKTCRRPRCGRISIRPIAASR